MCAVRASQSMGDGVADLFRHWYELGQEILVALDVAESDYCDDGRRSLHQLVRPWRGARHRDLELRYGCRISRIYAA